MNIAKPSLQVGAMKLIRLALIAGVVMFGAVILFVHRQPSWKPGTLPPAIGYALLVYAIVALAIARVVRGRILSEGNPAHRASLLMNGWAVAEGAGLLGGVIFFVTGQGQWYLIGLVAMLCAFAMLPLREPT